MVPEALTYLDAQSGGRYIDATCGEGGHARSIVRAAQPGGQLLGIDADSEAISVAQSRLSDFEYSCTLVNQNFRYLRSIALKNHFAPTHGVLFDLGVSSLQLESHTKGLSFGRPDPLDMRFSLSQKLTAGDIVNEFEEEEVAAIIYQFGEERAARRIARAIVKNRPIKTSSDLASIVTTANPLRYGRIHPATKTFQALRIAVNDELTALEQALEQAVSILGIGGRLVVISYHSLEDRIVKSFMRRESADCICLGGTPVCKCEHVKTLKPITKRPVTPTVTEVTVNPRSRSAKLRAAERM